MTLELSITNGALYVLTGCVVWLMCGVCVSQMWNAHLRSRTSQSTAALFSVLAWPVMLAFFWLWRGWTMVNDRMERNANVRDYSD